jgi:hypothetical protein
MLRYLRFVLACCVLSVLAIGPMASCASVPIKERISDSHQLVRTAITAFDDAEIALCAPDPAKVNHCTSPQAATIGLTDARHQAISRALADAYTKDKLVSAAIIAWKAGDPKPATLDELLKDATDALTAAQAALPGNALIAKGMDLLTKINALAAAWGGK